MSYIYSFIRGITFVTRNGLIVRARRAGGNLCNLANRKRQRETKKGMVLTLLRRCSFHVFVAYRVYSPIRLSAVSMETRGKTYRFSLFGDSSERELFQESLGPSSVPLLSSPDLSRLLARKREALYSLAGVLDSRASLARASSSSSTRYYLPEEARRKGR